MAILVTLFGMMSNLYSQSTEAKDILAATKINGGICLLLGASNLDLAKDLAENSELYIQVIQADEKLAEKWSFEIAASPLRFKINIRNSSFQTDHYGSNLINLIIVKNESEIKNISSEDINRILTPRGFLLSTSKISPLPKESASVENEPLKKFFYQTIFRKNTINLEWAPADSLKWRADPRAHIAIGFMGATHGSGKFAYRETMETKDSFPKIGNTLFVRDSFNGRIIWQLEEPNISGNPWSISGWSPQNHCMALDESSQFFYITLDKKLVCLDAETGKQKGIVINENVNPSVILIHDNKYLLYNNTIYSTTDYKKIFNFAGNFIFQKDKIYTLASNILKVYQLNDGKIILEKKLDWFDPKLAQKIRLYLLCDSLLLAQNEKWTRPFSLSSLDPNTGEKNWSIDMPGLFSLPARPETPNGKSFADVPQYTEQNGKIIAFAILGGYYGDHQEGNFTRIDPKTGKIEEQDYGYQGKLYGSNCNNGVRALGDYLYYWHNIWYNFKTGERIYPYLIHPGCFLQSTASHSYIYNLPSRKSGSIDGITSIGPTDFKFDQSVGGKHLKSSNKKATIQEPTKDTDWPMFRHDQSRGNFTANTTITSELKLAWSNTIGKTDHSFSMMMERRTGLTSASIAYGLAFVADIDSNCIIATEISSGKIVWQRSMPTRVDFAPSIFNGMCFLAGKDGWAYCLDAKTGTSIYQVLGAPKERFIGGQEKLESLWPAPTDIFIKNGIGYISNGFAANIHGGSRFMAFDTNNGKNIWANCIFTPETIAGYPGAMHYPGIFTGTKNTEAVYLNGIGIDMKTGEVLKEGNKNYREGFTPFLKGKIDSLLSFGNNLGRTNEDRAHDLFSDGKVAGRCLAFDETSSVAFTFKPKGESFLNTGECRLVAHSAGKEIWATEPIELLVDDIVLTPKFAFVVGHYYRIKGEPELWVLSREDGKVLNKYPVNGIPAFGGMSLSENNLYVATRDGKLICFESLK
jgi:outer membrane protein assembly factor BamB